MDRPDEPNEARAESVAASQGPIEVGPASTMLTWTGLSGANKATCCREIKSDWPSADRIFPELIIIGDPILKEFDSPTVTSIEDDAFQMHDGRAPRSPNVS